MALDDLARRHVHGDLLRVEPGEENVEHGRARGQGRDAVGAGLVGEHDAVGSADAEAGVVEELPGGDVLHAPGNRTGVFGGA